MLSYQNANFVTSIPNTNPGNGQGFTLRQGFNAVFYGTGSGLGARQIIGFSPLTPCPPRDCRDTDECWYIPVFARSTVDSSQNDFSTFMLEYPFDPTTTFPFDTGLSMWQLRKENSAGVFVSVVTFTNNGSGFGDYWNFIDEPQQFIYHYLRLNWNYIYSFFGAGYYDLIVTSVDWNTGAFEYKQCSELFKLIPYCCDEPI